MSTIFRNDQPEPVTIDEGMDIEVPAAEPPKTDRAKQIALYAFVALFLAVIGSSIAYLASRRSSAPVARQVAVSAPATVESKSAAAAPPVVPVPSPEAPVQAADAKSTAPQQQQSPPPPVVAPVASASAVKPPADPQPQPPQSTAALTPLSPGKMERPVANRFYLQVGSLEKGVAEVLTQGLRARVIQATVAPGVSSIVSRIIVGPFENTTDMNAANKILTDLGFKPFPRRFEPEELRKLLGESAASIPTTPQPDMRR